MDDNGAGCAVLVAVALSSYSWGEHSRAEELQAKLSTAYGQIEELKAEASSLEAASDNLHRKWIGLIPKISGTLLAMRKMRPRRSILLRMN